MLSLVLVDLMIGSRISKGCGVRLILQFNMRLLHCYTIIRQQQLSESSGHTPDRAYPNLIKISLDKLACVILEC